MKCDHCDNPAAHIGIGNLGKVVFVVCSAHKGDATPNFTWVEPCSDDDFRDLEESVRNRPDWKPTGHAMLPVLARLLVAEERSRLIQAEAERVVAAKNSPEWALIDAVDNLSKVLGKFAESCNKCGKPIDAEWRQLVKASCEKMGKPVPAILRCHECVWAAVSKEME